MSKKANDKNKDSQGLPEVVKKFFRVKGGGRCCNVRIEEVKEEKTEDKAETTGKK